MKQLPRLFAILSLAIAASCGHSVPTPLPAIQAALGAVRADSRPRTVHVIPFYDYAKSGYELPGTGGRGALIGDPTALYGSTMSGGSTNCSTPFNAGSNTGCGIVYRLVPKTGTTTYKLDVLHTFKGGSGDGAASLATLFMDKSGDLYGTTFYGGQYDEGTLFKLHPKPAGGYTETIVHSFGSGQDGAYPVTGVIEVNGILYGTTLGGGTYSLDICKASGGSPNGTCGTVYRVNPATGAERVLHSFGNGNDGASPWASLLNVGGTLYGTTDLGGAPAQHLCGTVFSIGTDGSNERVVHPFYNDPDGCNPFASLSAVNGTLYGTTCCGGGNFCPNTCNGTLFSVDLSTGKEQVLHKFGQGQDGAEPVDPVVNVHGVLYGTTDIGGTGDCDTNGCGTVFSYAPSPTSPAYAVVHYFNGSNEGGQPTAALLYSQGSFYGTTSFGGKKGFGAADQLSQ
ncbi:MAG: choice-of-anchor tandem repeat GloVer-containing protein [Candidatus Tumulicola sp.]